MKTDEDWLDDLRDDLALSEVDAKRVIRAIRREGAEDMRERAAEAMGFANEEYGTADIIRELTLPGDDT